MTDTLRYVDGKVYCPDDFDRTPHNKWGLEFEDMVSPETLVQILIKNGFIVTRIIKTKEFHTHDPS